MGQLLDKFERASKGTVQPLGFGAATKREKVAPILLVGIAAAGDDAAIKLAADTGIDALVIAGATGVATGVRKADLNKSVMAAKGLTVGISQAEATEKDAAGSDFQLFSSLDTPIGALGGEDRTNVMQVEPDIEESLLRTLEYLPVDVFLVSLADADKLTIQQLMRLARIRGAMSRWLLVHLSTLPTKEELEQLREAGISGVVVDLAGRNADDLKGCLATLLDLPHDIPERNKHKGVATLPSAGLHQVAPARRPEPEPDEDDDWEDD
jgi:hypothetical protein